MTSHSHSTRHRIRASKVSGVKIHRLKQVDDPRGNLCAGEFLKDVPFVPKRFFMVFDVPNHKQRGEHAHRTCHQFLLCIHGKATVRVTDGKRSETITLQKRKHALYVPPGIWCTLTNFNPEAILMVFASGYYDPKEYIRNFDEYLRLKKLSR